MWLVNSLKYVFLMFETHRYSQNVQTFAGIKAKR